MAVRGLKFIQKCVPTIKIVYLEEMNERSVKMSRPDGLVV